MIIYLIENFQRKLTSVHPPEQQVAEKSQNTVVTQPKTGKCCRRRFMRMLHRFLFLFSLFREFYYTLIQNATQRKGW